MYSPKVASCIAQTKGAGRQPQPNSLCSRKLCHKIRLILILKQLFNKSNGVMTHGPWHVILLKFYQAIFCLSKCYLLKAKTRRVGGLTCKSSKPQNWNFIKALHQFVFEAAIGGWFGNFSNFYFQNNQLNTAKRCLVH